MKLNEIDNFAEDVAVVEYINRALGTTFEIEQVGGADFKHIRLQNKDGIVFMTDLATMEKVVVGMLAVAKEVRGE